MPMTRSKSREPSTEPEVSSRPTRKQPKAPATKKQSKAPATKQQPKASATKQQRKAPATKQERANKKAVTRRAVQKETAPIQKKTIATIAEEVEEHEQPAQQQEEHEEQENVLEAMTHSTVPESKTDSSDDSGNELRQKAVRDGYGSKSSTPMQNNPSPKIHQTDIGQQHDNVDAQAFMTPARVSESMMVSHGNASNMDGLVFDEAAQLAANGSQESRIDEPLIPPPVTPATPTATPRSIWSKMGSAFVGVVSSPLRFSFRGNNTPAANTAPTDQNEAGNGGLHEGHSPTSAPQFTFEHEQQINSPTPLSTRTTRAYQQTTPTRVSTPFARTMHTTRAADAAITDRNEAGNSVSQNMRHSQSSVPRLAFESIPQLKPLYTPSAAHTTQAADAVIADDNTVNNIFSLEREPIQTPATMGRRHVPRYMTPKPILKSPKKSVRWALQVEVQRVENYLSQLAETEAVATERVRKRQAETDEDTETERAHKRQMTSPGTYRVPSPESDEEDGNENDGSDISMSDAQWDPSPSKTFSCDFYGSDDSESSDEEENEAEAEAEATTVPPPTPKPSHVDLPASVRKYQPAIPSKLRQVTEMSPLQERDKENEAPRQMGQLETYLWEYIQSGVEENREWEIDFDETLEEDYAASWETALSYIGE